MSPLASMYFSSELKLALPPSMSAPMPRVPRAVAVFDELLHGPVGTDGGGDLQPAGEGVHAADVGVEQIDRLETFAAHLGVEVDSARCSRRRT